jgi:hypothetical protein
MLIQTKLGQHPNEKKKKKKSFKDKNFIVSKVFLILL